MKRFTSVGENRCAVDGVRGAARSTLTSVGQIRFGRGRGSGRFVSANRPKVGTTVVVLAPVAEFVAVALGVENRRGALVLPVVAARPRAPGRAVRPVQVAVVLVAVDRGTRRGHRQRYDDGGGHRRPATTPVAPAPRRHLEKHAYNTQQVRRRVGGWGEGDGVDQILFTRVFCVPRITRGVGHGFFFFFVSLTLKVLLIYIFFFNYNVSRYKNIVFDVVTVRQYRFNVYP